MTAYTIQVSHGIYSRLRQLADATKRPIDTLANDALERLLPPSVDHIPERFQADLQALALLSDDELWRVARFERPSQRITEHETLLYENGRRPLTETEQKQLTQLQEESDSILLRTSYAHLLLKQRGYDIPNPYDVSLYE